MQSQLDIHKVISKEDVLYTITKNYNSLYLKWLEHQVHWINTTYSAFKDHEKYLIIITIVKKTLNLYYENSIKYSYEEYYSKAQLQIESFNIIEISKILNLPKETVRRKVKELEELGVIKRIKKRIILDRNAFSYVQPIKQIPITSKYISRIMKVLADEKLIEKAFSSEFIEKKIKENFTHIWLLFYSMQIDMVVRWTSYFGDMASFHVWGTCITNQAYNLSRAKKIKYPTSLKIVNQNLSNLNGAAGLNAMTLSDLTGIPRATVIRKLNNLVKFKYLIMNDKKQYEAGGAPEGGLANLKSFQLTQNEIWNNKAIFLTKIINYLII
jgi:predicted transcriptional regulator